MADNTTFLRGNFVSAGVAVNIPVPSGFDYFQTWNYSAAANAIQTGGGSQLCVGGLWQLGMQNLNFNNLAGTPVPGAGLGWITNGSTTVALSNDVLYPFAQGAGFLPYNSTNNNPGALIALTSLTNVVNPVITVASTASLSVGNIVRLFSLNNDLSLNGYDFAISAINSGTTFTICANLANTPGTAASTSGFYAVVPFDPLFSPTVRYITNIVSSGVNTVISLSTPSGYQVGQIVRVIVPADIFAGTSVYGMPQINNLIGTIIAVDDALGTGHQKITLNINSSGFTAFTFPKNAQAVLPLHKALVVPVGEDTAYALSVNQNILSDARFNIGTFGMTLAAGALSPAGQSGDVIFWEASTSYLF